MSLPGCVRGVALLCCAFFWMAQAAAQPGKTSSPANVPAVMLSDIHFDPFHDPAKFDRLRLAPVEAWQKILSAPDAPTQADAFAKLRTACPVRGVDTPWTLLESSLEAAHAASPHALFVTVSGDLMAHAFDCNFKMLAPKADEAEYSAFAAKTVAYVASEVRRAFPRVPLYIALGNNDSGCGDYKESPGSPFLASVARSVADGLDTHVGTESALEIFPQEGDYVAAMPPPIAHGRMIVLQDIFLSKHAQGCDGKPAKDAAEKQMEWLHAQLAEARERHEQVWVMAHVPPGIDVYSTMSKSRDVCAGQKPEMFLASETIVDVLTEFADVVRLAVFAHTHMDEMRLLSPPASEREMEGSGQVAAKLVSSISPINGNKPSITLAEVDARTAKLVDYAVVAANNGTGLGTTWTEEYRFSKTYEQREYTAGSLKPLMASFAGDPDSATAGSRAYEHNFFVGAGMRALAMQLIWPAYVCSMQENTEEGYRACACKKPAAETPAAGPAGATAPAAAPK